MEEGEEVQETVGGRREMEVGFPVQKGERMYVREGRDGWGGVGCGKGRRCLYKGGGRSLKGNGPPNLPQTA